MPIRYKVNCKTCQKCRGNPKLRSRIYLTYFKRDETSETLGDIAKEVGVSLPSFTSHCKKHLRPNDDVYSLKVETRIAKMKAKVDKEAELSFDHEAVVPKEDYEQVVDGVLAEGYDQLKKGNKAITVSQLLAAAKIKADYMSKKRGQNIEMLKTMYRMNTGDNGGVRNTAEATRSTN